MQINWSLIGLAAFLHAVFAGVASTISPEPAAYAVSANAAAVVLCVLSLRGWVMLLAIPQAITAYYFHDSFVFALVLTFLALLLGGAFRLALREPATT